MMDMTIEFHKILIKSIRPGLGSSGLSAISAIPVNFNDMSGLPCKVTSEL